MKANAAKHADSDMCIREVQREGMRELFVTMPPCGTDELSEAAWQLGQAAAARVISVEHFDARPSPTDRDGYAGPLTWVLGDSAGSNLGGAHMHAVAGAELETVELDGMPVGTVIHGPHASECLLGGIRAADTSASREDQARATFEAIDRALQSVGMDFANVARTWLFIDDILDWYDQFNRVRTAFFEEHGVFDRLVPASTGIGGANPSGAAMIVGAYAVAPRDPSVTVQALPSPLQCPAPAYGSSFSRAVEVDMPDLRRVFVSGTASIDPDGRTAHVGDVRAQTELTCEVIEAILHSREMDWEDVTRATAYVRHPGDAGVFEEYRRASGMPRLPVIVAHNTICRDELLFELEVDAVGAQ
ncbi:MAG: Rid family hydrolase [Armatimonadota bacterium]